MNMINNTVMYFLYKQLYELSGVEILQRLSLGEQNKDIVLYFENGTQIVSTNSSRSKFRPNALHIGNISVSPAHVLRPILATREINLEMSLGEIAEA